MTDVRPYCSGDADSLSQIYLKCRLEAFHWMPPETFELTDFQRDTQGEVIFVAVENSLQVGFISVWMQDNFIHHLFVDSAHHGKGIGRLLLAEALKNMGRPARLKCVVRNSKACKFYEANGWQVESTTSEGPIGPYHTYFF